MISELKLAFLRFFRVFVISKILERNYSGKGERQVAKTVNGIRNDHTGRYRFACKFINKGDIVFDCACGVGYGSFIMAKNTNLAGIIAVDKDKQAIKFAKRYYNDKKIIYRSNDIFSSDIPDNHFDCIVSFETVEHVDGTALIDFFFKKLKKNGLLILSTPNQDIKPFNIKYYAFHLRHYTPFEFSNLLISSNFKIVGKYTQYDRNKEDVFEGWAGSYNIAIAKKIEV